MCIHSFSTVGTAEQKRKREAGKGAKGKEGRDKVGVREPAFPGVPVLGGGAATENGTEAKGHNRLATGLGQCASFSLNNSLNQTAKNRLQTSLKLGKEYVKAVYCHPVYCHYLTYMQKHIK